MLSSVPFFKYLTSREHLLWGELNNSCCSHPIAIGLGTAGMHVQGCYCWSVEGARTVPLASPVNLLYSLKRVSLNFIHTLYRSCPMIQIGKCFGQREKLPCPSHLGQRPGNAVPVLPPPHPHSVHPASRDLFEGPSTFISRNWTETMLFL